MKTKINRTIIVGLIASSLLTSFTSCGEKLEEKQLKEQENKLVETLSLDSDKILIIFITPMHHMA